MKKSSRKNAFSTNRRLLMEGLENRYALSGMVMASIDDGNLYIEGDASANAVLISQTGVAGEVQITGGLSDALDVSSTTQVNSGTTPVILTGFTGDLVVNLRGGNDQLIVTDIDLPGMVYANLGAGNDTVALQANAVTGFDFTDNASALFNSYASVSVAQSVNVNGSAGDDVVGMNDATVAGDVAVYGGDGDDTFVQAGTTLAANSIGGQLLLNMSTGDDTVTVSKLNVGRATISDPIANTATVVALNNMHAARDVELYLSVNSDNVSITGDDTGVNAFTAENLAVHTGNGDDTILIDNANVANLSVYSGAGNEGGGFFGVTVTNVNAVGYVLVDTAAGLDNVLMQAVTAAINLDVNTGTESDGLIVQNSSSANASFNTDADGDVVGIYDSIFEQMAVALSDGDDNLYLQNITASTSATLDGGLGTNNLNDLGGLALTSLTRISI